uniref:Uncharacterized protein n=1 Tax=Roseihalotalea indica TaxID=2867963 RepID=A0AA49GK14_9BACT|nr:hypothetical protein K4G66_24390 [Tunicatimonas sp. TK19036]
MKKLLTRLLLLGITVLLPLSFYNYSTDFYGVFKGDLSRKYNEPNFRFIKTKFVLDHSDKYDSYIFGSSRVGKIIAYKYSPSAYNMYYSEGIPSEFLEDIKLLIQKGVTIKNIYIGLDEFSFKIFPQRHQGQLLRLAYHQDWVEDIASYMQYLIEPPKIGFPKYEVPTNFDYTKSGAPLHYPVDSAINSNPEAHITSEKFNKPAKYHGKRVDATIKDIQEIINLCKSEAIDLTIFINPAFVNTYTQYSFNEIAEIKLKLAKITEYEDFSGFNKITMNPINYYESNHYRYHVGDSIWLHCSGKQKASFAKHVTENNIQEYLQKEKAEWIKFTSKPSP